MNKGIIMEVKPNYAIIMNDDGVMEKILKKKNMNVGQKVFYFEEDVIKISNVIKYGNTSFMKTIGVLAALFLMAFTFFYQLSFQEQAYAVVSLDINPSIQIEVDSDKNIIKVEGMNEDGKNLDLKDLEGLNINTGIPKIKQILEEKNYLKNNKDVLVAFALANDSEDETYEESVISTIKSTFDSEKVTYVKGKKEDIEEAKTKGISLGRYEASQIADQEVNNTLDKAPVKDITELIKDKENVVQWGSDSEDKVIKIPDAEVVGEEEKTNETPTNNSNKPNGDVVPPVNITDDSNSNQNDVSNSGNSNNEKHEDDVLEVKPDPIEETTIPPNEEEIVDKEDEVETPETNDTPSENPVQNNDEIDNQNSTNE